MFDLLFYLKEFLSSAAIIFCIATFYISLRSDSIMLEAAKEVWGSLFKWLIEYIDERKEKKFFTHWSEIVAKIESNVKTVVGDTRHAELCRLAQSAIAEPLISHGYRLGMVCIQVSVYYADANEKQQLESLLTNALVEYLSICHCDTRVLADWTMRNDLAMPVLLLHVALTKEQQKNLNNAFASRSKKIIAKNTPVVDDTEDVDLF